MRGVRAGGSRDAEADPQQDKKDACALSRIYPVPLRERGCRASVQSHNTLQDISLLSWVRYEAASRS